MMNPTQDDPERLLTVQEVAELTNTPVSWWYGRSHTKTLPVPPVRIGSYLRFRRRDVLAYIDHQVEGATQ
jgi:excisionase family DNA binding protein